MRSACGRTCASIRGAAFWWPTTRPPSRGWLTSFSLVEDAFWLPDGSVLVQYADRRERTAHWRLLKMTVDGERVFEIVGTPRLLTADDGGRTLVFVTPESLTPNRWSVGSLGAGIVPP